MKFRKENLCQMVMTSVQCGDSGRGRSQVFESEPDKLTTELEFLNDNLRRRQNLEAENLWEDIRETKEQKFDTCNFVFVFFF